jgi:hypothetical protein
MDERHRRLGQVFHAAVDSRLRACPSTNRSIFNRGASVLDRDALEFLGDMRAITAEDRDWLRYYREPSQNWKIWIAYFDGEDQDEHWSRTYGVQHTLVPTDEIGGAYCDTRISTLVIGHLCAHIFYSHDTEVASKMAYDGVQLTQLWPASGFDLHTVGMSSLDGRAVLWLHEAYAREAPGTPRNPK